MSGAGLPVDIPPGFSCRADSHSLPGSKAEGDRWFESLFLQERVHCELDRRGRDRPAQRHYRSVPPGSWARPPIGLYLLNKHVAAVRQMEARFNAFRDNAYHGAQSIPGYTWICFHFHNNAWRYRADAPAEGDNLRKFLAAFPVRSSGDRLPGGLDDPGKTAR
jgi:hypothetical protein